MPLFARAAERYMPRCWGDAAGMGDRLLFRVQELPAEARPVLMGLDAQSDFESYAFTNSQRAILRELIRQGYAEACEQGAHLTPFQQPRKTDGPYLREVHWAITGHCNLNCRHCFMEAPAGKYPQPDWAALTRLVNQFVRANAAFVSLTGGEPLLHPDIRPLVALLSDNGITINQIVTNGMLLDASFSALLRETGQKPAFQISFDGLNCHDRMRGVAGAEKAALNAIELCVFEGFLTAVTSIFSRENIDSLLPTYEKLKTIGVSTWMVSRAQTAGMWHGGAAALTTEEMGEAFLKLQRLWLEDGKPINMLLESFYEARPAYAPPQHEHVCYTPETLECADTRERIFLLPDGNLLPCPGFTGTAVASRMPNLRERELTEVLQTSLLADFCREARFARLAKNPECASCEHFAECGMGCRAYALTEGGSLDGPDPNACTMYRQGWRRRFAEAERLFMEENPQ
ncbi:MAG: radical SAM protein [Eubacteriales bacterium]|nr:radical SAM protein [Eubacteriales bacterium]